MDGLGWVCDGFLGWVGDGAAGGRPISATTRGWGGTPVQRILGSIGLVAPLGHHLSHRKRDTMPVDPPSGFMVASSPRCHAPV